MPIRRPPGRSRTTLTSIWGVSEIRAGLVAGTLLLAGFLLGLGGQDGWALALNIVALVVGAATFVPETLKKLTRRKIGVGTLMTIAAVGAVILGQFAEAACRINRRHWSRPISRPALRAALWSLRTP